MLSVEFGFITEGKNVININKKNQQVFKVMLFKVK